MFNMKGVSTMQEGSWEKLGFDAVHMLLQKAINFLVDYSFQIMGAIIVLTISWLIGNRVRNWVLLLCKKKKLDVTLADFLAHLARVGVMGLGVVFAMSALGITIAPLIAAIGAGAFGISLAIQGPVSNFGAGVAIILTRPFKVGDTISLHGVSGVVDTVQLGLTILKTENGERITIPNKKVLGEILTNSYEVRVVNGSVGVAYASDMKKAIEVVRGAILSVKGISDQSPIVGIDRFADSSVEIAYRFWIPSLNYQVIRMEVNLAIFDKLKEAGIQIPFPQREVLLTYASDPKKA